MTIEKRDFIVGMAILAANFPLTYISFWFTPICVLIGFNLAVGNFRYYYNKHLWKRVYWRKQRKLWKKKVEK